MRVKSVYADGFRNLKTAATDISEGVNVVSGDNGQGKTNFLEAVYICAAGRSWRTKSDRDLINFGESQAFLRLTTDRGGLNDQIAVHIKKDEKKSIAVNALEVKKLGELLGTLLVVAFSPDDLALVKYGPAERRRFMDVELCQLYKLYYYELKQYYHILKQRNNLLKDVKSVPGLKKTIGVWDELLAGHGAKLTDYRADFIRRVNAAAGRIHAEISDNREKLEIIYKPSAGKDLLKKLTKSLDRDVQTGATSVGPHKDDAVYLIDARDARVFGSQGQQRLACLSSKLAEMEIIREEKKEDPVLLLDDVLSELDEKRQMFLFEYIKGAQALVTTAAPYKADIKNGYASLYVKNGEITRRNEEASK